LRIAVIIPALNEEASIGKVIADIPASLAAEILVVDNGSSDATARVAREGGARVISEPRRGYGVACLAGIAAADKADIIVFLDGDYSDFPGEMPTLLQPLLEGRADLVIGSRLLGKRTPGALPPHTAFGNRLFGFLLRLLYHQKASDLGPFRAIRRQALLRLKMRDRGYGWTAEMQAKAARLGLRTLEVPVSYRRRIGKSKISGSLSASLCAGWIILWTLLKIRFSPLPR